MTLPNMSFTLISAACNLCINPSERHIYMRIPWISAPKDKCTRHIVLSIDKDILARNKAFEFQT
jgi:hypothetical protein